MGNNTTDADVKAILGPSASWDSSSRTLTLNNVIYECEDGVAIEVEPDVFDDVTIKVIGTENRITTESDMYITCPLDFHGLPGTLTIEGNGSTESKLEVVAGNSQGDSRGIWTYGGLKVSNMELVSTSGQGSYNIAGIFTGNGGEGGFEFTNSKVTAEAKSGEIAFGIYSSGDSKIKDSDVSIISADRGLMNLKWEEAFDLEINGSNVFMYGEEKAAEEPIKVNGLIFCNKILVGNSTTELVPCSDDPIPANSYKIVKISMVNEHTVTYVDAQGGTGPMPDPQQVPEDTDFTVATTASTCRGMPFSHWVDVAGTKYIPGSVHRMGTSDIELTAVYESPSVTHTVTYDINGGNGTAPRQSPVKEGDSFTVKGIGEVTKAGCFFGGWTIVGDSTQHIYKEGDIIKMGTSDVTFKAVWVESSVPSGDGNDGIVFAVLVVVVILAIFALGWSSKDD